MGSSVTGDTSLANPYLVGPTASSCEGSYNYDDDVGGVLWYSVQVASEQDIVVNTCSAQTLFDSRIAIMSAGSAGCYGPLSCLFFASSECGLGSSKSFTAFPAITYYVAVIPVL